MRDARYSVLREIMNTNEKLQEALTYSDKKMSAVPDLFGDDPKKYRGFPNITCAPGHRRENDSETVRKLAFMKEASVGASNLDILSETVMDGTALNDISELQQNTDENNNEQSLPSNRQSKHDSVITSSTMQNSCSSSTSSTLLGGAERQNEGKKPIPENCDAQTEEKIFHETK
ncbi:spindle and centriole-associated 1-like isoform X1, partial [Paramuricea clavata]